MFSLLLLLHLLEHEISVFLFWFHGPLLLTVCLKWNFLQLSSSCTGSAQMPFYAVQAITAVAMSCQKRHQNGWFTHSLINIYGCTVWIFFFFFCLFLLWIGGSFYTGRRRLESLCCSERRILVTSKLSVSWAVWPPGAVLVVEEQQTTQESLFLKQCLCGAMAWRQRILLK